MGRSRREFLAQSSMGLIGAVMAGEVEAAEGQAAGSPQTPTPGAPPAFGTAAPVGPEVTPETFVEAEKLVQVTMSAAHRAEAAGNWRQSMAAVYERRVGPRKVEIEYGDAPATVWNPLLPGFVSTKITRRSATRDYGLRRIPERDEDIAFAPCWSSPHGLASRRSPLND